MATPSLVKKGGGGGVAQRHDGGRNLLTTFIDKICNNVEIEPPLQPLDNERFHLRGAVTSSKARLDIKAGGFWARGVTAFFDVRVTHVNSKCSQSKPTSEVFKEQEEEKKRKYQQRVLDVEMGSFTPLVFGTNGGMGKRVLAVLKASRKQDGSERYRALSYRNHLAQDTDFV